MKLDLRLGLRIVAAMLGCALVCGEAAAAASGLISVDFGPDDFYTESGVEAAAAAADPIFAQADVWNSLVVDSFNPDPFRTFSEAGPRCPWPHLARLVSRDRLAVER